MPSTRAPARGPAAAPERAAAPLRPSRGTTSVDAPGGAAVRVSSEARTEPRLRKVIESLQKRAARASTLTGPASVPGAPTGGAPLAPSVRDTLESTLQTDLQSVRVHTGARAQDAAASLSARAFTFGNHVFLGPGERATDAGLLAHEAAHVVQQQGAPVVQRSAPGQGGAHEQEAQRVSEAVGRGEPFNVRERTSGFRAQRLGIGNPLNYFAEKANNIPGFRMFTVALGMNPINMTPVDRSAANVMRAAVELIPGGALITEALNNHGVFDRAGSWVEQQIRSLGLNGNEIHAALTRFVDSLKLADLLDLGGVWARAQRIFTEPIQRLTGFLGGLVSGIGQLIKDAILRPLARLAEGTRGYDLLKAVLRQDPITGEPVQADAEALIGGFMKLIGQEETWENLKRGNAVGRAWAWFQGALGELLGFVRQVPGQFLSALRSLELADIVLLPRAFAKVASAFGGFIGRFLSWAGNAVWNLLEIIFSVVAPKVMPYLRRAAATFRTILRDPIGFIGNLVKAGLQGLRQFAGRFLTHLRASLIGWLTGAMSGAGIYIPQGFTLVEVLKFVLSVLRVTWQSLRQKLMRAVGEPAVRAMETTFDLVRTLVTQGPAAAWEQIQQSVSNLRDMVMEQVMTFVRDRVVQAAITRLVTSLNPAGAFIQAIIATYNTVMFFVERMSQIAQVAASVIDSLAAIASGAIGAAANRVEQTMAGLLTLVISFLARIAGLGRVSDAVTNVINAVRQPIDRGLDRVVDWIVAQARRIGRLVASGAQRAVEWWRARKAFTNRDGESHVLLFQESGDSAQILISSDEKTVDRYLADHPDKTSAEYLSALSVFRDSNQIIFSFTARNAPEAARRRVLIESQLARISLAFARLAGAPPESADYPKSTVPRYSGPPATHNSVEYLVGESTAGSRPPQGEDSGTPGWRRVLRAGLTKQPDTWVQMHVISAKMGGLGQPNNLISAPGSINLGYFRSFEHATIKLAKASMKGIKNIVWVDITVSWRDNEFASNIAGRAGLYAWKGKTSTPWWHKMESPSLAASAPLPRPDFHEQNKISLNFSSGSALRTIISDWVLVELIKQNRPYRSIDEFRSKLGACCVRRGIAQHDSKIAAILSNPNVIIHDIPE
ncbi:DUF4157 domain-containing protein [Corallococcus sp. AB045]|uniref:eCIS core domain-containing protein n=1 Tax=Corallococcus sp. AB045 TaxID=2316719 RepID=UPI000EC0F8DC|nr:DUF4157 domain-containing protein [Corallococcus sp. AB045]RKH82630.1 DUF4157 domain-containing protein [Corallococcus sp. AB045]